MRIFPAAARLPALVGLILFAASPAMAEDWFMPGQGQQPGAAAPRAAKPTGLAAPAGPPALPAGQVPGAAPGAEAAQQPPPQVPLPPPPTLPPMAKVAPPPAVVVGVLAVPDVMRSSTAAQEIERVFGQRRDKLNQDAQKEQAAWRDMQESLVNERAKLSPEQIRTRERQLQERITTAQRTFRERGKIIQDSAQYSLAQIERTLVSVIRQVAEAHGMNLVLHRAQVALNINELDITADVTKQINAVLPKVVIPPDGQEPTAELAKQAAEKAAAATPAAAPPAAATPAPATPAASNSEPKPAAAPVPAAPANPKP